MCQDSPDVCRYLAVEFCKLAGKELQCLTALCGRAGPSDGPLNVPTDPGDWSKRGSGLQLRGAGSSSVPAQQLQWWPRQERHMGSRLVWGLQGGLFWAFSL